MKPQILSDLSGHLLVAMPGMADPRFDHAVVLMTAHDSGGAMGLIINKPMPDLGFAHLLTQMEIVAGPLCRDLSVQYGGPVERGRGFVLHPDDQGLAEGRIQVAGGFAVTTTRDILEDIAQGNGPRRAVLALGYAGWGAGQLEAEIARNDWLTVPADAELVFGLDNARKWASALARLGIDPLTLSAAAGRA